jgi:FkbM family methyltransferase
MSIRDQVMKLVGIRGDGEPLAAASSDEDNGVVVVLSDGEFEYRFSCRSAKERRRAERMFDKEKGTVAWLKRELRPDDVFFDIGSNIGVYTLFGAHRLGDKGQVVAFEPHIPNASSLMANIMLNKLERKVRLVTSALTNEQKFDHFNYQSLVVASSTSQFGRSEYEGESFEPVFVEIKHGCSIDMLLGLGAIPTPNVIKIDVDGLDYEVLAGMRGLLNSAQRPRSIQIELGSDSKAKINDLMKASGYALLEKHWTQAGQDFIAKGNDPEDYPHYGIYAPAGKA